MYCTKKLAGLFKKTSQLSFQEAHSCEMVMPDSKNNVVIASISNSSSCLQVDLRWTYKSH